MNMKLSEVVNYKSQVQQWELEPTIKYMQDHLMKMMADITEKDIGLNEEQNVMLKLGDEILDKLSKMDVQLSKYKTDMRTIIYEIEKPLIEQSYQWYNTEGQFDNAEYIQERYKSNPLISNNKIKKHLLDRIKHYSDWKYSGLVVRPEVGDIADPLVDCSPLYIADTKPGLFDDVKQCWTNEYQTRLRYYTINEERDNMFGALPKNQIGIAVFYNFFNFLPLDKIEQYLLELQELLCEGATVIFTYNNCDYPGGVLNAENSMNTYTPGRLVRALVEKVGFEILDEVVYPDSNVSWFEIKKPGDFESIRGGQELAKVITETRDII